MADEGGCEGPLENHHFLKAQRVRYHITTQTGDKQLAELAVSDDRNIFLCCRYGHHGPITGHTIAQPMQESVQDFADDWDLQWAIDRDKELGLIV